ncbi:zinc-ribbon domain containing protein [Variovorax fucosicus]|uniref:zinc-ribbon domain containing protein n=1 Tax=Variovorax fucosicus TaxID=3053517 RepID=UPI0025754AD1|nr:zinc-ribbon domain containing protein [Variovorax sp. J22G47]MDM0058999.1 zinc-ribbon domain containing protein [Variovorax sp. J22G47]
MASLNLIVENGQQPTFNEQHLMGIQIDRSQWSPRSQRTTGHYDEAATDYEGIRCRCRKCTRSFVFTAKEQQFAYEVEKRFVDYLPKHCKDCAIAQ